MKYLLALILCLSISTSNWAFAPMGTSGPDDPKEESASLKTTILKKMERTVLFQKIEKLVNPEKKIQPDKNILNLLAGIFGIASVFLGIFGIPLGIAGLVLGVMGVTRKQKLQGLGITGIVIGGLWIIVLSLFAFFLASL